MSYFYFTQMISCVKLDLESCQETILWYNLVVHHNIVVTTVLWYFCYNLAKNIIVCLLRPNFSPDGVWQQSCDSNWPWILSRNNLVIQSCGTSHEYYKSCGENYNIVVTTVLWYFCYNLAKNIKVCLIRPKFSWDGVWQQSCDSYSNWNLAKNPEPPKILREGVKNILRGGALNDHPARIKEQCTTEP